MDDTPRELFGPNDDEARKAAIRAMWQLTTVVRDETGQAIGWIDPDNECCPSLSELARRYQKILEGTGDGVAALGRKTTYPYGADNRQTKMTDPLGRVTTFVYDAFGNATNRIDRCA